MKVLIPIDESDHSRAAIDQALATPWPAGTKFRVLSVARTPVTLSTEMYAPGLSYDDEVMKAEVEFRSRLADQAVTRLRDAGYEATAEVLTGDPRLEITDVARREGIDQIIVGSHGRTGLQRLLLGSVAAYVVSHAPCSVLVVKLPERAA
jgi:nucleotide-binding universal stress UspA family protein